VIFVGLLLGYLTLLCGGLGVSLLLARGVSRVNLVESLCLGWLFGTGVVSLLLWTLGLFCSGILLASLVAACCFGLGLSGWISTSRSRTRFFVPWPRHWFDWILLAVLVGEIAVVYWIGLKRSLGWDGLLVWEAKARFAFLSGNVLPAHYFHISRAFTHPEYPLGIPFTELWLYIWMGEAHQMWIKTVFATFYATGVIQLAIISARLTGQPRLGCLVAISFFLVPTEIAGLGSAASGYADFPLGVAYLTAIGYLLFFLREPSTTHNFRIYAVSLAMLPWLKREGLILWLIAAVAGVAIILIRRKPRAWLATLAPGFIILLAWAFYLRGLRLETPPEFFPVSLTLLLKNAGRLLATGQALLEEVIKPEVWGVFWLLATVAVISLLARLRNLASATLLWTVIVPILAYSSIYIFSTAADYVVHIKLSLPRLLIQLVPVFWLAIALAIARKTKNSPEASLADLHAS
jgi:hypothetical protein